MDKILIFQWINTMVIFLAMVAKGCYAIQHNLAKLDSISETPVDQVNEIASV